MTTAVRTPPEHGTLSRYKYHKCRCSACTDRNRTYQRNARRQQAYGRWQPYTDAEPVRQHLRTLMAAGISFYRVADMIDTDYANLTGILYAKGGKQPRRKIRTETATLILAISPDTHVTPQRVDATGTRRRLQALVVMGWPQLRLSRLLGRNGGGTLHGLLTAEYVYSTTAQAVTQLYGRLHAADPETHGVSATSAMRARAYSRRNGWHGPLAWDDNIDDPAAQPDTTEVPDPELKRDELAALRREEIWLLATAGESNDEIARRLGLATSTVQGIRLELRRGARRDRTKQQMEAAA